MMSNDEQEAIHDRPAEHVVLPDSGMGILLLFLDKTKHYQ
jgi:hypothetical protein